MKQIKAPGPITQESAAMLEAKVKKQAAAAPAAKTVAVAGASKATGHLAGEKLYKSACIACHSTRVANAPKLGDKAAWSPLLAQGMDSIMAVALKGKGAMPPREHNSVRRGE